MLWVRNKETVSAKSLNAFEWVRHGMSVAEGDDLRLHHHSFRVAPDVETVHQNRRRVLESLGLHLEDLVVPEQVHGVGVGVVGGAERGRGATYKSNAIPECDALVSDSNGIVLGISVADCLPIFFVDPQHRAIGIAHSGWRGTAGRIAIHTLEVMAKAYGTRPKDCRVAIGAGISAVDYEVDERVFEAFHSEDREANGVFSPTREGYWNLNLALAVKHQLLTFNVPEFQIDVSPFTTTQKPRLFHSHRLHHDCPRMGAYIGIVGTSPL